MKRIAIACVLAFATVGATCHGQVPPSQPQVVTLTWTAPASCSGCTYVISRAAATGTTCPTPNVAAPNYTPLNQSNPTSALTYNDSPSGASCYIAQTLQAGQTSQPSNTAGPFTVPSLPLAPAISGQVGQ